MVNKGWLYGLMVFLAQTCNPYYSAHDSRNQYEEGIVFEEHAVEENEAIEIPADAFEMEEEIEVEPPRTRNQVVEAPPPPPPPPPMPVPDEETIFKVVEDMPRFPGCEQKAVGKSELKKCSDEEMLKFIYSKIEYPKIARENGTEGRVILQFTVARNGDIKNVRVLREPGGGTGAEAVRVVNMMPKWIPGRQRGRPVSVQYTLPVNFAFDDEPEPPVAAPEPEKIFKVVDEMPRFPGCENKGLDKKELKECADGELLKFVYSNIVYPQEARKNDIEGRVIMQWIVHPDGSMSDINVLRDPGGGCGEEAVRVAKLMPKFIPGKIDGKAVPVKYTFPVAFKLQKKKRRKRN